MNSSTSSLLSPEEVEVAREKAGRILTGLGRTILGQEELLRMVVVACLARGHILLEGLPGLDGPEGTGLCDAITVNPMLGRDSVEPFLEVCDRLRELSFIALQDAFGERLAICQNLHRLL